MSSKKHAATGQKERKDYAEPLDGGRTGLGDALQDLPTGEHTTYTGVAGPGLVLQWNCFICIRLTEAAAGAFLLLLWLLCHLHLHSPSTSVPTLVKATTSLLPLARALTNFLFQTMTIDDLHGASSVCHLLMLAFTVSPLCYPYNSYKSISPVVSPPPLDQRARLQDPVQAPRLSPSWQRHFRTVWSTGPLDHTNHLPPFPVSFSCSPLQLICSY